MHRTAHFLFSMGISALFAYTFVYPIIVIVLCAFFGGILGILPDIDIRMKMKHRSWHGTHGPIFFLVISSIFTALIISILYGIDYLAVEMLHITSSPIEEFDPLFVYNILMIWIIMFAAIFSHILIDMITHSGIEFGSHHVSGSFVSSSPIGNFAFAIIGFILTAFSVSASLFVRSLDILSEGFFNKVLFISLSVAFGIILIAIVNEKRKHIPNLYCGNVRDIPMCIVDKPCVTINGKKICFDPESHTLR